jgi:hypothetical protein
MGWNTTRVTGLRWPVSVNFSGGRGIQSTEDAALRTGAAATSSCSCAICFSMSIDCTRAHTPPRNQAEAATSTQCPRTSARKPLHTHTHIHTHKQSLPPSRARFGWHACIPSFGGEGQRSISSRVCPSISACRRRRTRGPSAAAAPQRRQCSPSCAGSLAPLGSCPGAPPAASASHRRHYVGVRACLCLCVRVCMRAAGTRTALRAASAPGPTWPPPSAGSRVRVRAVRCNGPNLDLSRRL